MGTVADLLAKKGRNVACTSPEQPVLEAVFEMNEKRIGAVVVVDEERRVRGMFTERDVLRRVVGAEKLPRDTKVGEVMTEEVACCRPETTIDEVRSVMARHRIRHLPVCSEEGELVGIVSIGDLNAWELDGKEETIYWLNEYIAGRT
jgi:CBS domain-containing protein